MLRILNVLAVVILIPKLVQAGARVVNTRSIRDSGPNSVNGGLTVCSSLIFVYALFNDEQITVAPNNAVLYEPPNINASIGQLVNFIFPPFVAFFLDCSALLNA
jgi:hypothetical protein